jgi:carbon-monoxide dehydrogenase large subunit
MFTIASPKLGVPAADLATKNGKIYRKSLPSLSISIADLFTPNKIIALNGSEIFGKGSYISPVVLEDEEGRSERMCCYYAYTAYGVEVAVNTETGQFKVARVVGAADMGQPINPKMCEGQIEGGMSMGVGLTVYEEMKFDNGIPLNPSFADYKIPTVMEIPIGDNMKSFLVWDHFDEGPFGAKGLGESTLSAVGPAIGNAIYNAVGVRIHTQPLSREKVWKAIQGKKGK